jgi:meso-butanediol dehydrogenase / (S,S)-butanediol dehydrogenase / diacetyl reductase
MSKQEFEGKVVVATGAAGGLGRATALAFAREGATLVLADINAEQLEATAALVRELGATVLAVPTDVTDAAACTALIERAVATYGRLDALCNIAGMLHFNRVEKVTPEAWDRVFAVNVRAPFFLSQAALPHLVESAGAIVNVASASAFIGHSYLSPYAASKAALVNLTKSMAMEYINSPVRINALAPGGIATPMTTSAALPADADFSLIARFSGLRGVSEPEDLTELLLYLASPRSKAVHGACFVADMGITAG